ncbi:class I SAM-dependent methyltransferase [Anoxybacterium hadale]|uniref:Class I SAM-dependent methyltransferase n=1 Tax=Anoxybacterium hadale TaxID=3408580 RepID=A0ACD1AEP2_9FIRM|nr:class I SAM-dependent methyltransferase [Clostridiales bacterium]
MERKDVIFKRYQKGAGLYDRLLSTDSLWSTLACKLVWGFSDTVYANRLLKWIPDDFNGSLLDVPVGTALFTTPKYKELKGAQITCLDYSPEMMTAAERKFADAGIENIQCLRGDVGDLPFEEASFDIVLSMNGFHAFPDKDAAFQEIKRVIKPGGCFIGCFYIKGENRRTDWFINHLYVPKGYFTPPFMTKIELEDKLNNHYRHVEIWNTGSIVCFRGVNPSREIPSGKVPSGKVP